MRSIHLVTLVVTAALVLAACGTAPEASSETTPRAPTDGPLRLAAVATATVDFEAELPEGDLIDEVGLIDSVPVGVSYDPPGDAIEGVISVLGQRTDGPIGNNTWLPDNWAMIFDGTCGGGTEVDCTGDDPDLFAPERGNMLIVSEDGDASDPDDAVGAKFTFDFSEFGPGAVDFYGFHHQDVEEDPVPGVGHTVIFYDTSGNVSYAFDPVPEDGDAGSWPDDETPMLPVPNVTRMEIIVAGSGAIDDLMLRIPMEDEPGQGCTPGFWRNWTGLGPQPNAWPAGYDPTTSTFADAFGVTALGDADLTLLEALVAVGGGEARLASQATAALLNAESDDVSYAYSVDDVIAWTAAAIAGGDSGEIESLKNLFDVANNAGCPLGQEDIQLAIE